MYLGVDIGATKTLVAVLTDKGVIKESNRVPTAETYDEFLAELERCVRGFKHQDYRAAGVAVPGRLDRKNGVVLSLGNLKWHREPIQADCEKIFNCPVVIENDANMAALSEAMLHKDKRTVLYITVSTGIGTGFVADQRLVEATLDAEGGHIQLPYKGRLAKWESFASGRAIYEHFGKKAVDIPASDEAAWKRVAHNLSLGFFELMAILQPELIIIGGSIGTYFPRFEKFLLKELKQYELPLVPVPPIVQAERPEEAVVYGCYDLARQTYGQSA